MPVLKKAWEELKHHKAEFVPAAGFSIIFGLVPIAILIWIFSGFVSLSTDTALKLIINLGIKSLAFSVFIPLVLIPFSPISNQTGYSFSSSELLSSLKDYPKYFLFSLISALYYSIIYIICFGLPGYGSDPILRLVWLVLVQYWVAIVLPVPALINIVPVNAWQAVKKCYLHFHDVRWNLYLMALALFALNALALLLFVFPLIFTLPLSFFAIRDYTRKLLEYELLDYRM